MAGPVKPNFDALGKGFWAEWKVVMPGVWMLGICVAVFYLGRGLLGMARARESGHPQERRASAVEAWSGGIGLAGIIALGTVLQIYFNLFF